MSQRELVNSISVVVRARNEAQNLRSLLQILHDQALHETMKLQLIVVDNESEDDTRMVAERFSADLVELSIDEFTWGRALNRGLDAAQGELVVLLSADAHPVSSNWLISLCEPFQDVRIGAVYGRQIPRRSAPLDEWVRVCKTFPDSDRSWSLDDLQGDVVRGLVASNACAVVRRSVWESIKYDEESHGAEELSWTAQVLRAGYEVRYVSHISVEHSHREPSVKQAMRVWELELEACRRAGRSVRARDAIRAIGAFSKRRIKNMTVSGAGVYRRIEGILCLPFEATVLAAISIATVSGMDFRKIRKRW